MALTTSLITLADSPEALGFALHSRGPIGTERAGLGFVPTMGALHAGHLELVRQAFARHAQVVVSIFVNPAQFGPNEDLSRYPRTLAADLEALESLGAPLVVYGPAVEDLYHPGEDLRIQLPELAARWEGAQRPGHFDGVCLVLTKLFHQVQPTAVYMGQKDFQQTVVVRRLLRDLYFPIELVVVPTTREADGLALSSRNRYLDAAQRALAPRIYATLQQAQAQLLAGKPVASTLEKAVASLTADGAFSLDYLALVDGESLLPLEALPERLASGLGAEVPAPTLIVTARLGTTRLLDNLPLW